MRAVAGRTQVIKGQCYSALASRTQTRLLWNVLCPSTSPSPSGVVQLTLRPPLSLPHLPFREATTPGPTPSLTTALTRNRPRPFSTTRQSPDRGSRLPPSSWPVLTDR